jgi:signal transduction histidine kinase
MIAPVRLPSLRQDRYQGDDQRVSLGSFSGEDQLLLKQIYGALLALCQVLKPHHDRHSDCRDDLSVFLKTTEYQCLIERASLLGHSLDTGKLSEEFNRVIHDLRGGAFQALSFHLQLFALAPDETKSIRNAYFLVRDHLKIIRHCVPDIDPERFKLDKLMRPHDTQLLVEKWSDADFHAANRPVHINLTCLYEGTICESCLELASLDRIIYNLMNNAARFTADDTVQFGIAGVPEDAPELVRFVVANPVDAEHRRLLTDQFGDQPGELFRGGFTTGGHGVGTRICADFCSHAFGISDFDEALHAGYFGARWVDDVLAVWFHWPIVAH